MKNIFKYIAICILFLTSAAAGLEKKGGAYDEFYANFVKFNPEGRRNIVIDALDRGIISLGMDKCLVEEMFKERLTYVIEKEEYCQAVVLFQPIQVASKPLMSPVITGWYLSLRFDRYHKLEDYFLSSRHPYWGHLM